MWEGTAEAIILTDPDGIVLAVNPAYCTLYGCTPQTRIGHSFALIFPEAERAEAEANYHAFFTDPDPAPHLRGPRAAPRREQADRRGAL